MRRRPGIPASVAALAAAGVLCPSYAFAEEGGGIAQILPKMDEFLPMLVAFIIIWIILAKFGWPLFEGMLSKRENKIKEDLKSAEDSKIEGARMLEERRNQLDAAKEDVSRIIVEARENASAMQAQAEENARAEAKAIVERGHTTVEHERKVAADELQQSVVDLSIALAGRMIGEELSDEEHRKIIERYVREAGSLNAG